MGRMINSVTNDYKDNNYYYTKYFPISSYLRDHKKKPDTTMMNVPVVPIVFCKVFTGTQTKTDSSAVMIRVLLDSGSTQCMINADLAKHMPKTPLEFPRRFNTGNGVIEITEAVDVTFTIPEMYRDRTISIRCNIMPKPIEYPLLVGTDLLSDLKMKLDFDTNTVHWDEAVIPFKPIYAKVENINDHFHIAEGDATAEMSERMDRILAAKYEKLNIAEFVSMCKHLSTEERSALQTLLFKQESLFDGTLGLWRDEVYDIELKRDAKPYHARAYPVPKAYENTLKLEIDRLCKIGVLRKVNRSEWAAPTFIIPKKDGTVRVIADFRKLNENIVRRPFPIPKIQDLLLKLEGFSYATSLDLNMGYYHIMLSPESQVLCTIVLPWGKYEYLRLPMGLSNSPDIFQEKMSALMYDLEYVRTYLDDLLVITNGTYADHLTRLEVVLTRLDRAGLKVNAKKSFFAQGELEYLGYWITRKGLQPTKKKIEAITNMAPPTTRKQLRSFLGMVNYYRDMWIHRSDILAPLSGMTSESTKFVWTDVQQQAFDKIKQIVSREVMLAFPDFSKVFEIHTDASHYQLGSVISQGGKPIAFYSRKLSDTQTRYTTTERELLSIVETLKEFRSILLGQRITVYTDHKNLTYTTQNTERVLRWRLLIEEFNPKLVYLEGHKNIVADTLSRNDILQKVPKVPDNFKYTRLLNGHMFGMEVDESDTDVDRYPLTFAKILAAQRTDRSLANAKSNKEYAMQSFRGGGMSFSLVTKNGKIVIPKSLQLAAVQWYHLYLVHTGETRLEQTLRMHYWWNNLRETVHQVCKECHICQTTKKTKLKYGKLPAKTAEAVPWELLCVDLIGPYKIERKKPLTPLTLWALTMIDPATGWFEMVEIKTKQADVVANKIEQAWLSRYPWPSKVISDKGSEFKAETHELITKSYGIKAGTTTTRNPQANAILERIHQTVGDMIRTFKMYDRDDLDKHDPWTGVLTAIMAASRSTYSTVTKATPMQLVFGRDTMINTRFIADWDQIKKRKQLLIEANNQRENKKRRLHEYRAVDKVLQKNATSTKYGGPEYIGPYEIVTVYDNGTVLVQKRRFQEKINIRNIKPYTSIHVP
jgi:transposase InsO family protein